MLLLDYGFIVVLDSTDKLIKIIFFKLSKYVFYSGCSKRCSRFVRYFRYFLSKQLHRKLSKPRCNVNLPTVALVRVMVQRTTHTHANSVGATWRPESRAGQVLLISKTKTYLIIHPTSPPTGGRRREWRLNKTS